MKIIITDHAITRLLQRAPSDMTYDAARELLEDAAQNRASPLRSRTVRGSAQWRLENPDVVAVVELDARTSAPQDTWVMKTVLTLSQAGLTVAEAEAVDDFMHEIGVVHGTRMHGTDLVARAEVQLRTAAVPERLHAEIERQRLHLAQALFRRKERAQQLRELVQEIQTLIPPGPGELHDRVQELAQLLQ